MRGQTCLGETSHLAGVADLTPDMIGRAIGLTYRKLDLIDEQMRESGSPPLARLVELSRPVAARRQAC